MERLLAAGKHVRAMARDGKRAQQMLVSSRGGGGGGRSGPRAGLRSRAEDWREGPHRFQTLW